MSRSPCSVLRSPRGGFFAIFAEVTACGAPAGYYPAAGVRYQDGDLTVVSTYAWLWASIAGLSIVDEASCTRFTATSVGGGPTDDIYRGRSLSVRCLQAFALAILGRTEHGTRRTLSIHDYFSVACSVFRSPCSLFRSRRDRQPVAPGCEGLHPPRATT